MKGRCLCGQIEYAIQGNIGDIVHCHCNTCRKAHGAAFSSVAAVADQAITITGQHLLTAYESSPGKRRYFCSCCGTQLYAKREGAEHIILRLGSLDDDPGTAERCHIWRSEKASWYQLNQALPEYDGFEPD